MAAAAVAIGSALPHARVGPRAPPFRHSSAAATSATIAAAANLIEQELAASEDEHRHVEAAAADAAGSRYDSADKAQHARPKVDRVVPRVCGCQCSTDSLHVGSDHLPRGCHAEGGVGHGVGQRWAVADEEWRLLQRAGCLGGTQLEAVMMSLAGGSALVGGLTAAANRVNRKSDRANTRKRL